MRTILRLTTVLGFLLTVRVPMAAQRTTSGGHPLTGEWQRVAPAPGEAPLSTRDSGDLGGNMDFNRITEGTTAFLQMAIGLAGSLDSAFRIATSELANWLETDYKLSAAEAAIVLGTSIEYRISEVADRNVGVVAKMRKTALSSFSPRP